METNASRDQSFNVPPGTDCNYAQATEEDTTFTGPVLLLFRGKVIGVASTKPIRPTENKPQLRINL